MLEFGDFTKIGTEEMLKRQELLDTISAAEAELALLDEVDLEEPPSIEDEIKGASDYSYWKGESRIIVDILNAEILPITIGTEAGRLYDVELSHSEMESSQEMDLRIVRFWKQESVIEGGLVTHFRKVDIVEKRYNWNWERIN